MAKSLRSKWKRKMRAVKRERYGKKELDRLVNMLTVAGELPTGKNDVKAELEEGAITTITPISATSEVINLVSLSPQKNKKTRIDRRVRGSGRKSRRDELENPSDGDVVEMESGSEDEEDARKEIGEPEETMSVDKKEHVFSKRTMRDQFGNYPDWMNKRKMKTQQKKNKRIAKRRAISLSGKRKK